MKFELPIVDRPMSKYQKKNYELVEYHLMETSCPHCDKPFMIDYAYLKTYEIDGDYDWVKIYCPYCRKGHYEHL